LFFFCWMIFSVVFFSLSQSKLPEYILPAFPALAVLLAAGLARWESSPNRTRTIFAAIGGSWILPAAFFPLWWKKVPLEALGAVHGELVLLVAAAAVGGVVILSAGITGRMRVAIVVTALITMLLVEFANVRLLPQLDPFLSARAAARQAQTIDNCADHIAGYRLQRDWQYGLNFYLGNELPEWTPAENPVPADAPVPRSCIFVDAKQLSAIQAAYPTAVVIAEPSPRAVLLRLGE
jgi:4-amino-4-deoxy-L-arabinose transferase-like glycosyltransferase